MVHYNQFLELAQKGSGYQGSKGWSVVFSLKKRDVGCVYRTAGLSAQNTEYYEIINKQELYQERRSNLHPLIIFRVRYVRINSDR
jgi:hypothetical protein